jgi:acyl-homoserine lactone synthase
MTLVHVVTRDNRDLYGDLLESFFRLRHDVFVGERGWSALARPDGREIDAYDDGNAVYLLAVDGGRLVGGQRLYPTRLPHMLSEVFPHLASRGLPRQDHVFEWTRYFVVRERRMGRTDCRLLAALQAFCLEEGITEVTAVVEMWWLPRWHQAGFKVRPLGLPATVDGEPCIAAAVAIDEESLGAVQRLAGVRGPLLAREGPLVPVLSQVRHAA